jgi:hypothetical protein
MKKMQRRGKVDKDGKKGKDGKGGGGDSSSKDGKGGKDNFEGTESVASHDDGFGDTDDDDELVFDPMDDVATSDETSEAGTVQPVTQLPPPHSMSHHDPLDLRGLPMPPMQQHPIPHHLALPGHSQVHPHHQHGPPGVHHPIASAVESLHSANPIDKLYLMQDSYFTQM